MAARTRKTALSDEWRERIKTAALLGMVQSVAMTGKFKGHKVDPIRIRAAQILLGKVMPDLLSTELTGKGGGPLEHRFIDDEIARRLLSDPAPGGAPEAPVEAEPNGSGEAVLRVALLGKAGAARTNGHG